MLQPKEPDPISLIFSKFQNNCPPNERYVYPTFLVSFVEGKMPLKICRYPNFLGTTYHHSFILVKMYKIFI